MIAIKFLRQTLHLTYRQIAFLLDLHASSLIRTTTLQVLEPATSDFLNQVMQYGGNWHQPDFVAETLAKAHQEMNAQTLNALAQRKALCERALRLSEQELAAQWANYAYDVKIYAALHWLTKHVVIQDTWMQQRLTLVWLRHKKQVQEKRFQRLAKYYLNVVWKRAELQGIEQLLAYVPDNPAEEVG